MTSVSQVMECLFKTTTENLLSSCAEDVDLFHKYVSPGYMVRFKTNSFHPCTYFEIRAQQSHRDIRVPETFVLFSGTSGPHDEKKL